MPNGLTLSGKNKIKKSPKHSFTREYPKLSYFEKIKTFLGSKAKGDQLDLTKLTARNTRNRARLTQTIDGPGGVFNE